MALNGIPIPDDQCIGDSLPFINNAFTALDNNLINLSNSLQVTATNLSTLLSNVSSTIFRTLSGSVLVTSASTFQVEPQHNYFTVILAGPSSKSITRSTALSYNPGHETRFIQTGTGKVTFNAVGNGKFESISGFTTSMAGQYSSCAVKYINSSFPWILNGQLEAVPQPTPPPTPTAPAPLTYTFSITGPDQEDAVRALSIKGYGDTLYYNAASASGKQMLMHVYVNNTLRSNVAFSEGRLGAPFTYQIPNVPQLITGGFFKEGRIDLTSLPFTTPTPMPPPPTPPTDGTFLYTLNEAQRINNNQRVEVFTSGKQDVLYFNNDPAPSNYESIAFDIYVNNNWRMTVYSFEGRVGQLFGIKLPGSNDILTSAFTRGDGEISKIYITSSLIPTPTPTPTTVGLTETLTGPYQEDVSRAVSVTGNPDTFYYSSSFPNTLGTSKLMQIHVNDIQRLNVSFTTGALGQAFGIKLAGYTQIIYGVVAEGDVNLFSGQAPLPQPTPVTFQNTLTGPADEDVDNNVQLYTANNVDKLFFNDSTSPEPTLAPTKIMLIFVNGTQRSSIIFEEGYEGKQFGYNTNGTNIPQGYGVFAGSSTGSRVDISLTGGVAPTPTPAPTAVSNPSYSYFLQDDPSEGETTDVARAISILGGPSDTIYYNAKPDVFEYEQKSFAVHVNNTPRTMVTFTIDRIGQQFGYKMQGSNTMITSTFQDVDVVNLTSTDPSPTPTAAPAPTPTGLETLPNKLVGSAVSAPNSIETFNPGRESAFFFGNRPNPSNTNSITMTIFVGTTYYMTVYAFADYLTQTFKFSRTNTAYPEYTGIWVDGNVTLT